MTTMKRALLWAGLTASLAACGSSSSIGGGVAGGTDCQNDFTPERVANGENCDPRLNRAMFCPLIPGTDLLRARDEVIPCEGVTVSEHPASGGGFESRYIAIRPTQGGTPSAVYVNLHYLNAEPEFQANLTRMSELAKARNVLVLLPEAPQASFSSMDPIDGGLQGPSEPFVSRWPTRLSQPVESHLQLLDGVIADARGRFSAGTAPLYMAGLSNGAPMVYFYACNRAARLDAALAVAGTQNAESAAVCQPGQPVGLVIVHGTGDPLVPYGGVFGLLRAIPDNYADFRQVNQCGTERTALFAGPEGDVQFDWSPDCAGGRRVVLASLLGNGHKWPGNDASSVLQEQDILNVGLFGPARDDIDATIQGFDLLRYAAGF